MEPVEMAAIVAAFALGLAQGAGKKCADTALGLMDAKKARND